MFRLIGTMLLGLLIIAESGCGGVAAPSAQTPSTSPSSPSPSPSPATSTAPTVTSVTPTTATAGAPDLTVNIIGTNFVPLQNHAMTYAIWSVNGIDTGLNTTFVSSTELTAVVPEELLGVPVTARIKVVTDDIMSDAHHDGASSVPFNVIAASTQPPLPVSPGLSGNWIGNFIADMGPGHSIEAKILGPLSENNGAIASTGLKLDSDMCFGAVFVRSGTMQGTNVNMDMLAADFAGVSFAGTLAGAELNGTIQVQGSECGDGTGKLKMTKIPAATGIWTGTLHSDRTGIESQLTVSLTQTATVLSRNTNTAPFGLSSLKMTGLIQHAATGCILQVTTTNSGLLGDIQGLEINLESNGFPGILLHGSLSSSTTSLKGTYSLNGTTCSGETGTFTLIRK